MTTLTRWLLRAFADEWPGGLPDDLALYDRDDSAVLDVDTSTDPTTLTARRRTQEVELTVANALDVGYVGDSRTPAGLGGTEYRNEPVLSVRVEGVHREDGGHVDDNEDFQQNYVNVAREIIQRIDNGTLLGAPGGAYHAAEPTDENPQSSDYKDHFLHAIEVGVSGYEQV